jgi:hypothetical protein
VSEDNLLNSFKVCYCPDCFPQKIILQKSKPDSMYLEDRKWHRAIENDYIYECPGCKFLFHKNDALEYSNE